ncbi:MAG: undecaprenyldiphospho-muramoylpentapeptide beta-N-acetylglucosaminyltransferase [Rhodospirillaceae bacterium]|nr:undecaprenyldiphospho-muramoylpentapeptide beta-N-acetylglucosaminyltransferase [Rhodospirillaceae bacterium]
MSTQQNKQMPLVILAAGGTGGHIFPAEALAGELKSRGFRLGLITDRRGSAFKGTLGEIENHRILAGGIAGKNIIKKIISIGELAIGTLQAYLLLRRLKPACVIGFGGYASLPTMMAASMSSIGCVIHEQNALLGRANRLLAPRMAKIATSFTEMRGLPEGAESKTVFTGMPVRSQIAEKRENPYPDAEGNNPLNILVIGGSQGATVLSEVVPSALDRMDKKIRERIHVTQQCREEDLAAVGRTYQASNIKADLATFISDVPERLANAHLVIARSGASTVAEILAVGRPSILIPYPFAADDHQTFNARAVDGAGAGWIMPQNSFTAENLAARLDSLFGLPAVLKKTALSAHQLGRSDAAQRLADVVIAVVKKTDSGGTVK